MALEFKLEAFEGPLDLLLHLIDRNKVDIYDIPIAQITDQYMEYVEEMQRRTGSDAPDMNVMSEFLVMAATLLDIKCRMLLPREVNEEGEEEDPRAELVQKLLEYKTYKYMSLQLREMSSSAARNVYRSKKLPKEVRDYIPPVNYEELIGDTTLAKLSDIFQEILKRQKFRVDPVRAGFGKIEKEEIDLNSKILYIGAYLNEHRHTGFRQLLENQKSKEEVIVSFLVILELMKTGNIVIRQDELFGDIVIDTVKTITSQTALEDIA